MPAPIRRGRTVARTLGRPLLASVLLLSASCRQASEPLWLGLQIPLTDGAGQPDLYGQLSRMGAQMALDEINAADGIGGRRLSLRLVDDHGDDSTAIGVADSLANDPRILAVAGPIYSSTTVASAQVYENAKLPTLATSATSPAISSLGPYTFRVASSDSANAVALAASARATGLRTAVLYSNENYGEGLMRVFARALHDGGTELVSEDPYLEDMPDFRPYLARL